MSDVSPELQAAALDFLAEEAKEARARAGAVNELLEDAAPKAAAGSTPTSDGTPAHDTHTLAQADFRDLAQLAWTFLDIAAVKLGGAHYKLAPDELERLLPPTEKVLRKYLPPDFVLSPEYVLAGTALAVYVPKLLTAPSDAPPAQGAQPS